VASMPVLGGGALLPRASAASTAVEQRGIGRLAPYGFISRQARHTRSRWESSPVSGGAAPVDKCTDRTLYTNDCRQLHPVGEAPSRRAHRGIGQEHIPEWRLEAGGRVRGTSSCDDGSLAFPSVEGSCPCGLSVQ